MAWDSQGNLVLAGSSSDTTPRDNSALQPLNAGIPAYRSSDGGMSWSPDPGTFQPSLIVPDQGVAGRLWGIAYNNAFWVSTDFGRTWQKRSDFSGNSPFFRTVVSVPGKPDLLYFPGYGTTLKSSDGGITWTTVHTDAYFGIAVDPNNTDTVVAFGISAIFVSRDGGGTWTQNFNNRFYNLRNPQGFFVDPSNATRLLLYDSIYGILALDWTTLSITLVNPISLSSPIRQFRGACS